MAEDSIEVEVPSFEAAAPVFLGWAGIGTEVRIVYGPDPSAPDGPLAP